MLAAIMALLWPRTLEGKARLLVVSSIFLIMTLVLLWPWLRLESINDEQNLKVAREAARLELQRLHLPRPAPVAAPPTIPAPPVAPPKPGLPSAKSPSPGAARPDAPAPPPKADAGGAIAPSATSGEPEVSPSRGAPAPAPGAADRSAAPKSATPPAPAPPPDPAVMPPSVLPPREAAPPPADDPLRVETLGQGTRPPRWIRAEELGTPEAVPDLSDFERESLRHLRERPADRETNEVGRGKDGPREYRYLVLLRNTGGCLRCHARPDAAAGGASMPGAPPDPPVDLRDPPVDPAGEAPPPPDLTGPQRRFAADEPMAALSVTLPLPRNDWNMVANRTVIVLAGVLGAACALTVFYWIAQKLFLGPIRELRDVADRVGAGDLTARCRMETGDELQTLSETFDRMLDNLDAGRQRLRDANDALDSRLGEMAQVNVGLHEANRLKSEFLANVSHELRTPLNSIIGFADLLRETMPEEARGRRFVGNILTSSRNLLELINDLLDLAKIEAGRMDVRLDMVSPRDLVETLAGLIKPLADARRQSIDVVAPEPLPLIRSDPAKLRQIIYNFLSNAVKFTPAEGHIVLGVRRTDERFVAFSVSDTGPGIAKEDQQVIFEKFRQLDASMTREHQGTGLGLAISKELAAMLGGHIRVDSEPGHGATFTLVVPTDAEGVKPSVRIRADLSLGTGGLGGMSETTAPAGPTNPAVPADAKPADAKPADAKPADAKPADAKPAGNGAGKPGSDAPAPSLTNPDAEAEKTSAEVTKTGTAAAKTEAGADKSATAVDRMHSADGGTAPESPPATAPGKPDA